MCSWYICTCHVWHTMIHTQSKWMPYIPLQKIANHLRLEEEIVALLSSLPRERWINLSSQTRARLYSNLWNDQTFLSLCSLKRLLLQCFSPFTCTTNRLIMSNTRVVVLLPLQKTAVHCLQYKECKLHHTTSFIVNTLLCGAYQVQFMVKRFAFHQLGYLNCTKDLKITVTHEWLHEKHTRAFISLGRVYLHKKILLTYYRV